MVLPTEQTSLELEPFLGVCFKFFPKQLMLTMAFTIDLSQSWYVI